jgi:hypothetical protein
MKQALFRTAALAGLMGVAALGHAQNSSSSRAETDPAVGGQASTETRSGVGNATQRPDGSAPASRDAVKAEARAANRNTANSLVPKGEASTTLNDQPNAVPQPSGDMSRQEVSQEARKVKPQFGQKGERPDVPTNPMGKTGTPQ